jgi:N-acetylglucosamine-6-phosphate deacetylase
MKLNIKHINGGNSGTVEIEAGKIKAILPLESTSYDYIHLAPALVDAHINGGEEFHFTANPTEETLWDMDRAAAKSGVGYQLPALITSDPETMFKGIETVQSFRKKNPAQSIIGLHLEGPFISIEKRGAHLPEYIRKPDLSLIKEILSASKGMPLMMTIAPEHFENDTISYLLEQGVTVSLGHSNCTYERAMEVFGLGVKWITHLFNAMSPLTHRAPGLAGAALSHPDVYCPIIPDGVHVHHGAVKLALKLKYDRLFFISDALFQNGLKTHFQWRTFDAKLLDGKYINSDGNLAGANISMADALFTGIHQYSLSLSDGLRKCTSLPAEALGLPIGRMEVGYPAKFITFDENFEDIQLLCVKN